MIIAIDGPSGTGKSTVAKGVAKKLGFTFFDTGAMYRSVAWKVLKERIDPENEEAVSALMSSFHIELQVDSKGERCYFVGGEEITQAIREPNISLAASQVALYPEVRKTLLSIQRDFGKRANAVFEGRDMGTVVFPDADLKVFLTARAEVRAERRYRELLVKFPDLAKTLSEEQILKELEERDAIDSSRSISPLKQAEDAILIDTSDLSVDQVIAKILALKPQKKKKKYKMKPFYRFVYLTTRAFFKLFYRLEIYGLEHFEEGAAILAANHNSLYDPPVVSISCPQEVHFLAKESLFSFPLFGKLIASLNAHPVTGRSGDARIFRLMIQLLKEGKKVLVFPEGSRSFDGRLQTIERGTAFLALKANVPIFPIYLEGTFAAWPRTKKLPKPFGKFRCVFGSPIRMEEFRELDKKEAEERLTEQLGNSFYQLKEWLVKGKTGSPP